MSTTPTVVPIFQTPGPHPNGMQATAEGIWILDQHTNLLQLVSYTGDVLRTLTTESDRGSGVTFDGAALWIASTYDRKLLRVSPETGDTLAAYDTPGAAQTGAHGLEWRGGLLWVATPPAATIYQVDVTRNFQIVRSFAAPGNRPHGLAWQENDLWCVETNHRAFYRLDVQTGETLDKITLPEDAPEPHGMTIWDGHFWYCDANTSTVARFALP